MQNLETQFDVSRETLSLLESYVELLRKWNKRINLVSVSSLQRVWERHIWDSVQLYPLAKDGDVWVDIGSGGGLPGIVAAVLARQHHPARRITLVESDNRKAIFLRTVIRELKLPAFVLADRIENQGNLQADILTARALTDLSELLTHAKNHLKPSGTALFHKGETWKKELDTAKALWSFSGKVHKSITNPSAAILEIKEVRSA